MKTAFIDLVLSEVFAGYSVSTYVDEKCIERRAFRDFEDAETFAYEWAGVDGVVVREEV